jgi:hypothetical protein
LELFNRHDHPFPFFVLTPNAPVKEAFSPVVRGLGTMTVVIGLLFPNIAGHGDCPKICDSHFVVAGSSDIVQAFSQSSQANGQCWLKHINARQPVMDWNALVAGHHVRRGIAPGSVPAILRTRRASVSSYELLARLFGLKTA